MRSLPLHSRYVKMADGCWIWLKGFDIRDYPQPIYYKDRNVVPYKAVYEDITGESLRGKEVDHVCRVRRCVNPAHLQVVTHTENIRRRTITKLSMEKAREIRAEYKKGLSQSSLASSYGVSRSVISEIVNNKAWQEGMELN